MLTRQLILSMIAALLLGAGSANAQRNVTPAIERDPVLEADAKHNLDVALQAFTPHKQAYKQVLSRFEETLAAYPEFSKMDEFLYMAGMSSWYLSQNKGKQKVDLRSEKEREKYAPEKLRADAIVYLQMLVDKYPQSRYLSQAQQGLRSLTAK